MSWIDDPEDLVTLVSRMRTREWPDPEDDDTIGTCPPDLVPSRWLDVYLALRVPPPAAPRRPPPTRTWWNETDAADEEKEAKYCPRVDPCRPTSKEEKEAAIRAFVEQRAWEAGAEERARTRAQEIARETARRTRELAEHVQRREMEEAARIKQAYAANDLYLAWRARRLPDPTLDTSTETYRAILLELRLQQYLQNEEAYNRALEEYWRSAT